MTGTEPTRSDDEIRADLAKRAYPGMDGRLARYVEPLLARAIAAESEAVSLRAEVERLTEYKRGARERLQSALATSIERHYRAEALAAQLRAVTDEVHGHGADTLSDEVERLRRIIAKSAVLAGGGCIVCGASPGRSCTYRTSHDGHKRGEIREQSHFYRGTTVDQASLTADIRAEIAERLPDAIAKTELLMRSWAGNANDEDPNDATMHLVRQINTVIAGASFWLNGVALAGDVPPKVRVWGHCRWHEPHLAVVKLGSVVDISRATGMPGAECATCGEALWAEREIPAGEPFGDVPPPAETAERPEIYVGMDAPNGEPLMAVPHCGRCLRPLPHNEAERSACDRPRRYDHCDGTCTVDCAEYNRNDGEPGTEDSPEGANGSDGR